MAAAAIWNLSKSDEIMGGITRFLGVSDTLERMAAKGKRHYERGYYVHSQPEVPLRARVATCWHMNSNEKQKRRPAPRQ